MSKSEPKRQTNEEEEEEEEEEDDPNVQNEALKIVSQIIKDIGECARFIDELNPEFTFLPLSQFMKMWCKDGIMKDYPRRGKTTIPVGNKNLRRIQKFIRDYHVEGKIWHVFVHLQIYLAQVWFHYVIYLKNNERMERVGGKKEEEEEGEEEENEKKIMEMTRMRKRFSSVKRVQEDERIWIERLNEEMVPIGEVMDDLVRKKFLPEDQLNFSEGLKGCSLHMIRKRLEILFRGFVFDKVKPNHVKHLIRFLERRAKGLVRKTRRMVPSLVSQSAAHAFWQSLGSSEGNRDNLPRLPKGRILVVIKPKKVVNIIMKNNEKEEKKKKKKKKKKKSRRKKKKENEEKEAKENTIYEIVIKQLPGSLRRNIQFTTSFTDEMGNGSTLYFVRSSFEIRILFPSNHNFLLCFTMGSRLSFNALVSKLVTICSNVRICLHSKFNKFERSKFGANIIKMRKQSMKKRKTPPAVKIRRSFSKPKNSRSKEDEDYEDDECRAIGEEKRRFKVKDMGGRKLSIIHSKLEEKHYKEWNYKDLYTWLGYLTWKYEDEKGIIYVENLTKFIDERMGNKRINVILDKDEDYVVNWKEVKEYFFNFVCTTIEKFIGKEKLTKEEIEKNENPASAHEWIPLRKILEREISDLERRGYLDMNRIIVRTKMMFSNYWFKRLYTDKDRNENIDYLLSHDTADLSNKIRDYIEGNDSSHFCSGFQRIGDRIRKVKVELLFTNQNEGENFLKSARKQVLSGIVNPLFGLADKIRTNGIRRVIRGGKFCKKNDITNCLGDSDLGWAHHALGIGNMQVEILNTGLVKVNHLGSTRVAFTVPLGEIYIGKGLDFESSFYLCDRIVEIITTVNTQCVYQELSHMPSTNDAYDMNRKKDDLGALVPINCQTFVDYFLESIRFGFRGKQLVPSKNMQIFGHRHYSRLVQKHMNILLQSHFDLKFDFTQDKPLNFRWMKKRRWEVYFYERETILKILRRSFIANFNSYDRNWEIYYEEFFELLYCFDKTLWIREQGSISNIGGQGHTFPVGSKYYGDFVREITDELKRLERSGKLEEIIRRVKLGEKFSTPVI